MSLNDGERDFVLDLRKFYEGNKDFFEKRELYLLRNMSRGRGIGLFEAGDFHPDFIVWVFDGKKQYVNFVDPKGIRNLEGPDDPTDSVLQDDQGDRNPAGGPRSQSFRSASAWTG